MPRKLKPWEQLTPRHLKRLQNQGITEQSRKDDFARGYVNPKTEAARGHKLTPERATGYTNKALKFGIATVVHDFDSYTPREQNILSRQFLRQRQPFKGKIIPNPNKKSKTLFVRTQTDAQIKDDLDWTMFLEQTQGGKDAQYYENFKAAYNTTLS